MEEIIWHYKSFNDLTSKELYKIVQLRNEVFVIEQDCIYQDCDDKDLFCGHLWATIGDEMRLWHILELFRKEFRMKMNRRLVV